MGWGWEEGCGKYSLYTHRHDMWGGRRWKFKSNNTTSITFHLFRTIKKFFQNIVSKDITPDYLVWETERKNDREITELAGSDHRLAQVSAGPKVFSIHMK